MSQAEHPNSMNPSELTLTRKGERYARAYAGNRDYFLALASMRKQATEEIDRLLSFLDNLDGDTDLEDGADDEPSGDESEPSLGWTTTLNQASDYGPHTFHRFGGHDDTELDTADDEDSAAGEANGDDEPADWEAGHDHVSNPAYYRGYRRDGWKNAAAKLALATRSTWTGRAAPGWA